MIRDYVANQSKDNNKKHYKNKTFLEENDFVIIRLPNLDNTFFYNENISYNEDNLISAKYCTYLNYLEMNKLSEFGIFQIIDCDNLIIDFNKFKHDKLFRNLNIEKPQTHRIYIKYQQN